MTIAGLVRQFVLADVGVASLIGTRIYPDDLPQKVPAYPAVKLQTVDANRISVLKGKASSARVRLQFDVFAAPTAGGSREAADAVGTAIRMRLEAFVGYLTDGTISPPVDVYVQVVEGPNERGGTADEINGGLSEYGADYLVEYETHGGAY